MFPRYGERNSRDNYTPAQYESLREARARYLAHTRDPKEHSRANLRHLHSAGNWGRRYWTREEFDFAVAAFVGGRSYRDIAYALQRSIQSVRTKLRDPDCSKRHSRDKNKPEYKGRK